MPILTTNSPSNSHKQPKLPASQPISVLTLFQHGTAHEGIWETREGRAVGRAEVVVVAVVVAMARGASMLPSKRMDERCMVAKAKL